MTTPGSLALILPLVALVVAVTGYAGGRLHQKWRAGRDRDEAYREGYDTATRSVFTLAARVIGPRRAAVRGSAEVRGAPADGGDITPMPPAPAADRPAPAPRTPSSAVPVRTNSASHFITGRPASGGERDGDVVPLCFPVPNARLDAAARPLRRSSTPRDRQPSASSASPVASPVASPADSLVVSPVASPADSPADSLVVSPASSPALPPASLTAAQAASSHAAPDAESDSPDTDSDGPDSAVPAPEPESSGRHTVPDELVQAVTYRLPPDRVFRAKVPNRPGKGLADDPTARLPGGPVPKPRSAFPADRSGADRSGADRSATD